MKYRKKPIVIEAVRWMGDNYEEIILFTNNASFYPMDSRKININTEDLDCFTGKVTEKQDKVTVVYARCSTAKQKENLDRQKERLMRHAESQGYKYIVIDEIASGINEKRKGLHKLLNMAFQGKIDRVLIEYKDRIARFGYEYLWSIFRNLGVKVEIMENREKKYEEELAEDIMKILTCYSARYYGARGGRKKKIEVVESNAI